MVTLSVNQYARRRGVASQSVRDAIEAGRLVKSIGKNARGHITIEPELADKEWAANTDATMRMVAAGGDASELDDSESDGGTLAAHSAKLKKWQAARAELQFKAEARELIPVGEIKAQWLNICVAIRSKLLALPSRARQQLPHLSLADVAVLESIVREALEELARDE